MSYAVGDWVRPCRGDYQFVLARIAEVRTPGVYVIEVLRSDGTLERVGFVVHSTLDPATPTAPQELPWCLARLA